MQSKKMSLGETLASTAIGFVVSVILTRLLLPFYNMHPTITESMEITVAFTIASILRGYFVRRLFEGFK